MDALRKTLTALAVLAGLSGPVTAHEFWLDAFAEEGSSRHQLALDFKVGQRFVGQSLPYVPDQVVRFLRLDDGGQLLGKRLGDLPAASVDYDPATSFAAFVEMAPRRFEHNDWPAFLRYLEMEGLDGIRAAHLQRGLPKTGFTESYARHAKLIVLGAAGHMKIASQQAQAKIELHILSLERVDENRLSVRGRLTIDGVRAPGRHLAVFDQSSTELENYATRTMADGTFALVVAATGKLLLNAVMMTQGDAQGTDWHSDWASLLLVK